MKALLAALVFAALATFAAAAPSTLKEVFAQEASWRVEMPPKQFSFQKPKVATESAAALLARIASARSDSERKTAAFIAKANLPQLDALVLTPAAEIDAAKAKALRSVLERAAGAAAVSQADAAELKRLLDAAR